MDKLHTIFGSFVNKFNVGFVKSKLHNVGHIDNADTNLKQDQILTEHDVIPVEDCIGKTPDTLVGSKHRDEGLEETEVAAKHKNSEDEECQECVGEKRSKCKKVARSEAILRGKCGWMRQEEPLPSKVRRSKFSLTSVPEDFLREMTTSQLWSKTEFDPFQVFEIDHESCLDLEITIHRGEQITKGSAFKDRLDTPDPYVILRIPGSSNCSKRTSHQDNCTFPLWNETFHFFLDPTKEHNMEVTLMDANYSLDEILGMDTFCINTLTNDIPVDYVFNFPGGSKVYATLKLQKNKDPDLRYSLALCDAEKEFLQLRRVKVLEGMKKFLGNKAPTSEKQVPIIGILGSGGGFRAMTCLSGVAKALQEKGVVACCTYIAGLSGSSWYISTLYAHDLFPNVTHAQVHKEMKEAVTTNWKWHLKHTGSYIAAMYGKYKKGQPVSFTDFFGHLLGDVLLKGKKQKKLTDQRKVLAQGLMPFPLYTCLHAKRNISCKAFSEWVEFSPYEIGIAKYGTFMKTEHFGCKMMVGKMIKAFDELPLHFLQGVWGSAFTVLFKRMVMEGGRKDIVQIMREAQHEEGINDKLDNGYSTEDEESDTEDERHIDGVSDEEANDEDEDKSRKTIHNYENGSKINNRIKFEEQMGNEVRNGGIGENEIKDVDSKVNDIESKIKDVDSEVKDNESETKDKEKDDFKPSSENDPSHNNNLSNNRHNPLLSFRTLSIGHEKNSENKSSISENNNLPEKTPKLEKVCSFEYPKKESLIENTRKISDPGVSEFKIKRMGGMRGRTKKPSHQKEESVDEKDWAVNSGKNPWAERKKTMRKSRAEKKAGFFDGLKGMVMGSNFLSTRQGRAGEILNPFRGLSLKNSFPFSPLTYDGDDEEEDDVDGEIGPGCRYQPLDNKAKKLFIVDSGLAFNSPYPLLLRPQRAVDLYLSFDFSQRPNDDSPPFKELLIAESWAIQNKVPFPPIEKQVKQYLNKPVEEVYVFKHPTDTKCPIILHFALVNNKFKEFKAPGVRRETEEELENANFPIFDDPKHPYSSMNFVYEPQQFDRLAQLMEFNTLLCIDTIKEAIIEVVNRKKNELTQNLKTFQDVARLQSIMSKVTKRKHPHELSVKLSSSLDKHLKKLTKGNIFGNRETDSSSDDYEFTDALENLPSSSEPESR